jgi:hypothetical protein
VNGWLACCDDDLFLSVRKPLCREQTWSSKSIGSLDAPKPLFLFIQVVYRSVPGLWLSRRRPSPSLTLGINIEKAGPARTLQVASRFFSPLPPLALTLPLHSIPCFINPVSPRRTNDSQQRRLARTGLEQTNQQHRPHHRQQSAPVHAGC